MPALPALTTRLMCFGVCRSPGTVNAIFPSLHGGCGTAVVPRSDKNERALFSYPQENGSLERPFPQKPLIFNPKDIYCAESMLFRGILEDYSPASWSIGG